MVNDDDNLNDWLSTHRPWQWLGSTRRLQEEVYKFDYSALSGDALADYVTWNSVALQDELHEFLGEVNWKTWAKSRGDVPNRSAAVEELVDIGHFLANLASALGVTDEEWEVTYRRKQLKNATRQRVSGGYGRDLKCPTCQRALDAPDAVYWVTPTGQAPRGIHCTGCHTMIAEEIYGVLREHGLISDGDDDE